METTLRDQVEAALHTVYDPEIPVNIFDLGLVYNIEIGDDGQVLVVMTLTAPGCPVAGTIMQEVNDKILALEGVAGAEVRLAFDLPSI